MLSRAKVGTPLLMETTTPAYHDDPNHWSADKLRRKEDQAWEMAGLARQDGDKADAKRHTENALRYRIIRATLQ